MSGHGGNLRELARLAGRPPESILDFSASINPLGPPACLRPVISRGLDRIVNYPDPAAAELVEAIARRYVVPADRIVVGNGSTELLHAIARALASQKARRADGAQPGRKPPVADTPLRPSPDGALAATSMTADAPSGLAGLGPDFRGLTPPAKRPGPFGAELPLSAVIPVPTYTDYAAAARLAGLQVRAVELSEDAGFVLNWDELARPIEGHELVFLGQPNNPTGLLFDNDEFRRFAAAHATTTFVVDEAFADFVEGYRTLAHDVPPNVIVLCSLTKFYAIPGLRLGFAVAEPSLARRLREQLPNWSVNSLAQALGAAMLADEDYARRTVAFVAEQRQSLAAELAKLPGLCVYPGRANFLLVKLNRSDLDASALAARLLKDGIAIRTFGPGQHLDGRFFRVAVRSEPDNEQLLERLSAILGVSRPGRKRQRTPAIMFQGTSSNAGKSVLTAALCRILLADGVRVAPFKSQNMSLNSFVTRDGGEMGRAQVVQAQACRLEPDVRMNPILLKPNSDTGSQVIVRGRPVGNMRVGEYVRYKPTAFAVAKECYDALADEFDAIVLEGAGSPGEVNLKSHDIVNMRMAEYAAAPVLVVGDIDRGGVFASFVGTMEVLAGWEQALVAGWVVNRFRGDATLLGPAVEYTLAHTGRPVFGVVPYLTELNIPQEDSVEFKSGKKGTFCFFGEHQGQDALVGVAPPAPRTSTGVQEKAQCPLFPARGEGVVHIAVIDLPHISNFTDLDAFAVEPDVRVTVVRAADDLGSPDAIIIPGSKNTLADLAYLRQAGLAQAVACRFAEGKSEVIGLCAGFQMLGKRISDPHRIESESGAVDGLGLLDVHTTLAVDKTLVRSTARHEPSGLEVFGYEIHHGQTGTNGLVPVLTRSDGQCVGAASADHRVWGTYLHGVFDADAFRRWFIDRLRVRRGLPPVGKVLTRFDIEPALDRLAAVVRQSLDMKAIYRLLKL